MKLLYALLCSTLFLSSPAIADDSDPYLWLEDVDGARSIEWVKQQNARSTAELKAHPDYAALYQRLLGILENKDRIAAISFLGEHVYNFW